MAARKGKKIQDWVIRHEGQAYKVAVRMDGVKLRACCGSLDFEIEEDSLPKLKSKVEKAVKEKADVTWVDKLIVTVQGDFGIVPRPFHQPGLEFMSEWPKTLEGTSRFSLQVQVIELGSTPGGWKGWREKNKTFILRGWPELGDRTQSWCGDSIVAMVDPTPEAQATLQSISVLMNRTFLKLKDFLHPDRIQGNLSAGMPALLAAPEPEVDPPADDDIVNS